MRWIVSKYALNLKINLSKCLSINYNESSICFDFGASTRRHWDYPEREMWMFKKDKEMINDIILKNETYFQLQSKTNNMKKRLNQVHDLAQTLNNKK